MCVNALLMKYAVLIIINNNVGLGNNKINI